MSPRMQSRPQGRWNVQFARVVHGQELVRRQRLGQRQEIDDPDFHRAFCVHGPRGNDDPDYECAPTDFDTAAWLVYPSRDYIPLKLRAFIDFLRQTVTGYA